MLDRNVPRILRGLLNPRIFCLKIKPLGLVPLRLGTYSLELTVAKFGWLLTQHFRLLHNPYVDRLGIVLDLCKVFV